MKTRRAGSRSGCAARQISLSLTTSGRSCSLACAVFFEGLRVAIEEAPDRARRKPCAVLTLQMIGDFGERDVDLVGYEPEDFCGVAFDPARALVASLRTRRHNARVAPAAHPLNCGRGRHPEPVGRGAAAQTSRDGTDQAHPKIVGKRSRHAGWPPSPARILNQYSLLLGIPADSVRWEIALARRSAHGQRRNACGANVH